MNRVLIVAGERQTGERFQQALGQSGYQTAVVWNPMQMVEFCRQHAPDFMVVEVPAWVDGKGLTGIRLDAMPRGFAGLLANQVAVHDLTAQAIIEGSKDLVLQALLVDPVVDRAAAAVPLVDAMIELQPEFLGYLT